MKINILKILLVISVLANGVLGYRSWFHKREATKAVEPRIVRDEKADSKKTAGREPAADQHLFGPTDRSPEGIKAVAVYLKREGYPEHIINSVVAATLGERNRVQRQQLERAKREGDRTAQEKIRTLDAAENEELNAITTVDEQIAEWEEKRLRMEFGDLAPVKRDAVIAIDGSRDGSGSSKRPGDYTLFAVVATAAEEEAQRARVASVLTPEEYADYVKYRSLGAIDLQERLRDVEITENVYLSAVEATLKAEQQAKTQTDSASLAQQQMALLGEYRKILGDGKFTQALTGFSQVVAGADSVYKDVGLLESARIEHFLFAYESMMSWKELPRKQRQMKAQELRSVLIQRAQLSPDKIREFDASPLGKTLKQ